MGLLSKRAFSAADSRRSASSKALSNVSLLTASNVRWSVSSLILRTLDGLGRAPWLNPRTRNGTPGHEDE